MGNQACPHDSQSLNSNAVELTGLSELCYLL